MVGGLGPRAPLALVLLAVAALPAAAFRVSVSHRHHRARARPIQPRARSGLTTLQEMEGGPDAFRGQRMAPAFPRLSAKLQKRQRFDTRSKQAVSTLLRVALPTVIATIVGFVYFDNLSLYIRSTLDIGTIRILQADDAQFIQNFLTVIGLLFSILAGNAYSALYQQQESIYFALFQEVSEAKSLLEQTTLVCQGRPFYQSALQCIRDYVKNDLRRLDVPPAELLSTRPMEDPLESIMYMTSVGVPSIVYETVKNLRQARGTRLGAMQRKFPFLGIALLYLLAMVELLAFPLLGAGTATIAGVLSLQSFLFACLVGAHMLVLRIIQELWQSSGGVFNVDEVLQQMVFGLEEELELRSSQASIPAAAPPSWYDGGTSPGAPSLQPGGEGGDGKEQRRWWRSAAAELRDTVDAAARGGTYPPVGPYDYNGGRISVGYDALSPMPYPVARYPAAPPSSHRGRDSDAAAIDQREVPAAATAEPNPPAPSGDSVDGNTVAESSSATDRPGPRLPRQQRAFLGRVARAMMEGIQVIGKTT